MENGRIVCYRIWGLSLEVLLPLLKILKTMIMDLLLGLIQRIFRIFEGVSFLVAKDLLQKRG